MKFIPHLNQSEINGMTSVVVKNPQIFYNPHFFLGKSVVRALKKASFEDLKEIYFITKVFPNDESTKKVEFISTIESAEEKEDRFSAVIKLHCPNTVFTNGQINELNQIIASLKKSSDSIVESEINGYEIYNEYKSIFDMFNDKQEAFAPTIKFWFLCDLFMIRIENTLDDVLKLAIKNSAFSDRESINKILYFLKKHVSNLEESVFSLLESITNIANNKLKNFRIAQSDKKVIQTIIDRLSTKGNYQERSKDEEYINHIIELPLDKYDAKTIDLNRIQKHLDETHYGMQECKRYLLEHMLHASRTDIDTKGTVLCLVGEPGTGKTSISQALASCLDTDLLKIALGGVSDESEIRGHSRTYYGSQPGRLIRELKRAKSMSPVIILDEIDKLGTSFKGNPADALLELLDPEQNHAFYERYLGIRIDFSKVFWICTANDINHIPGPLLSRLNIVKIPSYSLDEKRTIMKNFIIPSNEKEFKSKYILANDLIEYMLREASDVRQLKNNVIKLIKSVNLDRYFEPLKFEENTTIDLIYYRNRFNNVQKKETKTMGFER